MTFEDLSDYSLQEIREKFISNGYRNCVYQQEKGTKIGYIYFLGFDKAGDPYEFKYRWQCQAGYSLLDKDPNLPTDIYGRSIKYKKFNSTYDRKVFLEDNKEIYNFVDVMSPEQEFLIALFWDVVENHDFNTQPMRVHWIDIETEISGSFEYPNTARNRVNMLTVYDSKTKCFYTWSLKKIPENSIFKDNEHKVFDVFNDNETLMLAHYLKWHSQNYPDVIQGWNSQSYDIPYLVRRMENVFGKERTSAISPFGKYRIRQGKELENPNDPNSQSITVSITGISHLDELILYRDKFMVKLQADGGYGLNNIGVLEGLGTKQEYEGSLKDLYENDWGLFYKYNVQDVKLLVDIEKKCKLINLARQIAGTGCMNYEAIYASISYIMGSLYCFSKKHMGGEVVPTYAKPGQSYVPYEGAYVFDVKAGFYKDGIATIDFNSLYPNTIRAANISPETLFGKVVSIAGEDGVKDPIDLSKFKDDDKVSIALTLGKISNITVGKLKELVKTKLIFTQNNTLFFKPSVKKGLLNQWSEHYYNQRKLMKREMAAAHKAGDHDKEELYNNIQHAIKIFLNSLYGVTGTRFSPIGNPDIAQTITRQGKFCNISANKFITAVFKKKFGIGDDYNVLASGDTDSQFLNIQCITQWFRKENNLPEKLNDWSDLDKIRLWEYVENFVNNEITPFVQKLLKVKCGCEDTSMLRYGLEYIADCGIYQAKKNYAIHKIISEGPELVDKNKYTGIELRRNTMSAKTKDFLAEIYENTLKLNWTEKEFRNFIYKSYDEYMKLSIDEIAQWKGYNTAKKSNGFMQFEKGASGISKACGAYNDLLKFYKIQEKYDTINVGDKLQFIYVTETNRFGIDAIAYKGRWPKEFNKDLKPDYRKMFDKCIMSPIKNFMTAMGYQNVDPTQKTLFDVFNF